MVIIDQFVGRRPAERDLVLLDRPAVPAACDLVVAVRFNDCGLAVRSQNAAVIGSSERKGGLHEPEGFTVQGRVRADCLATAEGYATSTILRRTAIGTRAMLKRASLAAPISLRWPASCPGGSSIAYASSKAALIHLTHCLAVALAPDVTVNCIAPGLVEGTRMADRVPEEMKQQARSQTVLGRTGSAQDIADQVVTFCRAESVTGQVIVVDGGMPGGMR
jgi:hypothetical protein